jgi:beta-phosphoglucomutase
VKLGLCSNARDITVTKILDLMKITDYFDIILSADDVQKSKPDPEIYLTACSKLSVIPQNCLIVEDSDVGVIAGKATGADLLIVTGPDNFKPFID